MRTGLFPGTFNPIHNGHLESADAAASLFGLDYVIFIVEDGPRKDERVDMCLHATEDNPKFIVAYRLTETQYPKCVTDKGITQEQYDSAEKYMLMGKDALFNMRYLNKYTVKDAKLLVCDNDAGHIDETRFKIQAKLHEWCWFLYHTGNNTDSADIRYEISHGLPYRYKLPAAVYKYIIEYDLYRGAKDGSIQTDAMLGLQQII